MLDINQWKKNNKRLVVVQSQKYLQWLNHDRSHPYHLKRQNLLKKISPQRFLQGVVILPKEINHEVIYIRLMKCVVEEPELNFEIKPTMKEEEPAKSERQQEGDGSPVKENTEELK